MEVLRRTGRLGFHDLPLPRGGGGGPTVLRAGGAVLGGGGAEGDAGDLGGRGTRRRWTRAP